MTLEPRPSLHLRVVRTAVDILRASRDRVAARIEDFLAAEGLKRHDALALLDRAVERLVQDLEIGRAGEDVDPEVDRHPLAGTLLDALFQDVLSLPEGPDTAAPAVDVLRVVDAARGRAATGTAAREAEDLEQRLRAPDAFQLMVEVAHDFRSPLTSILFLSEALRDGHSGPVTPAQHAQLGLMYSAAFGLASIASDVMDLARQERDIFDPEPEPYAPSEVFASVERLVRPIVDAKALELRIVLPDRSQAHGHPHALSRVLLNLTTNALKFTDDGRVEMGAIQRPRGRLEYYVQDTGRGIPRERRGDLFQPFKRRVGEAKDGHFFSGSGVGLSIARRLVRAMGGELTFSSSDEEGTRFWFDVPAESPRSRTL